jgi:hypothetical protein
VCGRFGRPPRRASGGTSGQPIASARRRASSLISTALKPSQAPRRELAPSHPVVPEPADGAFSIPPDALGAVPSVLPVADRWRPVSALHAVSETWPLSHRGARDGIRRAGSGIETAAAANRASRDHAAGIRRSPQRQVAGDVERGQQRRPGIGSRPPQGTSAPPPAPRRLRRTTRARRYTCHSPAGVTSADPETSATPSENPDA